MGIRFDQSSYDGGDRATITAEAAPGPTYTKAELSVSGSGSGWNSASGNSVSVTVTTATGGGTLQAKAIYRTDAGSTVNDEAHAIVRPKMD